MDSVFTPDGKAGQAAKKNPGEGKEPDPVETESSGDKPMADVLEVSRCPYCESKNIIKKGIREKHHEKIQRYECHDCGRRFTGQRLKGKRYPARVILDGISFYNLGYSYEESCRFLERRYGMKVDSSSLARWVEDFSDICTYGRIREYGMKLYSANQVIDSSKMFHRQVYVYRYHKAKMELLLQDYKNRSFKPLKQLLDVVTTECPHQLFLNSARSSETKNVFSLDGVRISEKVNYAVRLAETVLQAVTDNKLRHDAVQKFMLANDSVTVATEVPVFLDQDDLHHMRRELEFDIPLTFDNVMTGYIDILQVRNGAVHILDYKPDAAKQKPVDQLTVYALALSRLTGLRLYNIKCAWFDHKVYYEFFPLHVVYKKKAKKARGRKHTPAPPSAEGRLEGIASGFVAEKAVSNG